VSTLQRFLESLPVAWRALVTIAAVLSVGLSAGWAGHSWLTTARNLPARVEQLERDHQLFIVALRYMACRAALQDEGQDPRLCRQAIPGMDDFINQMLRR